MLQHVYYGKGFVIVASTYFWDWKVNTSVLYSFRSAEVHWDEHIPVPSFEIISESVSVIML